ncbi:hypothetical protein [Henriciella aquimarina]|uniref:hypothetical protein n=1 Tax=Henriciella aquimarina TaxID=545261 RepID=UPI000A015D23|nr:hypothetical protein [Henriciella aquimarina]
MKTVWPILLVALAGLAGGQALAQAPSHTADSEDELGGLPDRLDTFVKDAIDEGLLTPSARAPVEAAPGTENGPRELRAPVRHVSLRPKQDIAEEVCRGDNPLDFSAYQDLTGYDDLMAWRESAAAEGTPNGNVSMAKAYLALGLNEEARMQLDGSGAPQSTALRRFAHLMEGRKSPDVGYFRTLTRCHEEAGLWLALAQLIDGDDEGGRRLDDHLNDYRRLPFQLRADVAAAVVPVLSRQGEKLLAEKMMAGFTAEAISGSTQLTFTQALMDLEKGDPAAEATVRSFLNRPEYRVRAVTSLLTNGRPVEKIYQQEVAGEFVGDLDRLAEEARMVSNLDTMLTDLKGVADYEMTLELAAKPATQSRHAQSQLADHMTGMLEHDLASEDPLRNLAAMQALLKAGPLLEGRPSHERLLNTAASLAVELGFRSLADRFAEEMDSDDAIAAAQAELAFQMVDHDRIKALAERHPDNQDVLRLAALSAIRVDDPDLLKSSETGLELDAATVLALIEADAASNRWIVSGAVYRAAEALEDEAAQARAERVLTLRRESLQQRRTRNRVAMAEVGPSLDRIGRSLDNPNAEVR